MILSVAMTIPGGERTITGHVTDETGAGMAGVTVFVKNTKRGTTTDINGFYRIRMEEKDKIIVFQYVGYKTIDEKIGDRSVINVQMAPELLALEENAVIADDIRIKAAPGSPLYTQREKMAASGVIGGVSYDYTGGVWYNNNFNTEGYSAIHENGYKSVLNNPLSTFSIDVDRASYANVRRFISQGARPPVDAVRIEEMINYFNYDYPGPQGEHPFSVFTEVAECPWNTDHYLLHIGLKGKEIDKNELPPSNLVFLIDVSGSMNSQNKLPLLKSAFTMLVNELRPEDRVSIAVYAGAAGLVLEPTQGSMKEKILQAIQRLSAGGSTAGGEGLRLAYKVAGENFIEKGNNRIILATDGDFNVGVSSNAEMERLVEKERDRGIFMTVLGFGMGNYKDDKMEIIADKSNGNYAYIDNLQEANKVFVSEFGGTLFTIARDVKFQIEFNPAHIKSYRLIGYENRLLNDEDFNDDRKDAGEMGAGHTVTAIYELVPAGADEKAPSIDPLKYQENRPAGKTRISDELLTIKLRYKQPDGIKSILMEEVITGPVVAFEEASMNLRFSASVAGFGMILRESGHAGDLTLERVLAMARNARGDDEEGYRGEFIRLVKTAKDMNLVLSERE